MPLVYPGLAVVPPAGPFALALPLPLATCATTAGGFAVAGTIGGWCGFAWGSGMAAGHFFVFSVVGSTMVITGAAAGVLQIVPNTPAGSSCIFGAADWLAAGTVTMAP
ncbi:MAG TPA: hypothetical protein VHF47_01995 [Acidimicrobiales bacterium]|nr:hypothetical protein [Acidimicrobiales bacterium]